jgi:hypothetical protein
MCLAAPTAAATLVQTARVVSAKSISANLFIVNLFVVPTWLPFGLKLLPNSVFDTMGQL